MLNPDNARPAPACTHKSALCILVAALAGCGGEKQPSPADDRAKTQVSLAQAAPLGPAGTTVPTTTSSADKPRPTAMAGGAAGMSGTGSARFARMAALPLLASLSGREKAGLFSQLNQASPSERLSLINGYRSLEGLPDQQKQILLGQLESISPVRTPASRVVCNCSNDIKRELCVKENCSNKMELESVCTEACGTLAAFGHQCTASPQCAAR